MTTFVFEYIWLDSVNECRSKTKMLQNLVKNTSAREFTFMEL